VSDPSDHPYGLVAALAAQGVLNIDGGVDVGDIAEKTDSTVEIVQNALAMLGVPPATPAKATASPGDGRMFVVAVDEHPEHQNIAGPGETEVVRAKTRLLEHATIAPSPLIRALMGTADPAVVMMEELGTVSELPLFVRVSYYSVADSDEAGWQRGRDAASAPSPDLESVFRVRFGTDLAESQVSVEAVRPDRRTAELLRVPSKSPMVLRQVILTDARGVVRELSFTHFRADLVSVT
jgi:DNA-binding GntR family transcriptional regulator